ncbi:MAG TPA: radical SAM protein [Blastocatellia bacterium]|nr:radical SAM protein [Blastocatellia bacterium]
MAAPYPEHNKERERWVLARREEAARPRRDDLDPYRPYAFMVEDERSDSGRIEPVATIFLTNRECPWRCLMCDLWRDTLTESVPAGAIPAQIDYALARLAPARQIKLYNNGSFFDHHAIPASDYSDIAARLRDFDRVIVESHPALVGDDCWRFRDLLSGRLEVAMGLETVHPTAGPRLNKGVSLEQFSSAAERLRGNGVALRVFILVKPPFVAEAEALYWAERSVDFAFDCGASAMALIPTRAGNGALEALAKRGEFSPPRLATLEAATAYGIGLKRGRVFSDLWDLERLADCAGCYSARALRLREMNLRQEILPPVACRVCGEKGE